MKSPKFFNVVLLLGACIVCVEIYAIDDKNNVPLCDARVALIKDDMKNKAMALTRICEYRNDKFHRQEMDLAYWRMNRFDQLCNEYIYEEAVRQLHTETEQKTYEDYPYYKSLISSFLSEF